jgi:glycosyltransferase involved in cell wall biosynthesis
MQFSPVTVLMPVYNGAEFLSETIDSILSQTFKDFEFLIINDGSTDDSEKIILSYNDPRIKYLKNDINLGIIDTLNRGLDQITSKYIIRMDADDLALPNRLQVQVEYMNNHPEIVLSGSGKINFSGKQNYKEKEVIPIVNEEILFFKSIFNTSIPHPSAILRNDVIQKYNIRYDKAYFGAEDKAMWLDMAKYGKLGNISAPLIKYRAHDNQISYTKLEECRRSSVAKTLDVLRKYGISLSDEEVKALGYICYPANSGDIQTLNVIQKLCDKLSGEFIKLRIGDTSYIHVFFKNRMKRILVWSTPIGLALVKFIFLNKHLKMREFGVTFYKKAFQKAKR